MSILSAEISDGCFGSKPKKITNSGKNEFLVEISSTEQAEKITKLKNICGMKCSLKEHSFFNERKGMIYL